MLVQPLAVAGSDEFNANTSFSRMISVSVFHENGTEINIANNTTNMIEIIIPRDPSMKIQDMTLKNLTSMNSNGQQYYLYRIDIPQSNSNGSVSLHFEMRPENQSLNYLFIFKFDGEPKLNTNIRDIDDWYLFCDSSEY